MEPSLVRSACGAVEHDSTSRGVVQMFHMEQFYESSVPCLLIESVSQAASDLAPRANTYNLEVGQPNDAVTQSISA